MSIDPLRLVAQQRAATNPVRETKCDRCGRRTRDRTGTCVTCRNSMPNLARASSERIAGIIEACRAELKRRRDALDAALKGES